MCYEIDLEVVTLETCYCLRKKHRVCHISICTHITIDELKWVHVTSGVKTRFDMGGSYLVILIIITDRCGLSVTFLTHLTPLHNI